MTSSPVLCSGRYFIPNGKQWGEGDYGDGRRMRLERVFVPLLVRRSFEGENDLIFSDLGDAVGEWLKPEVAPVRFARPNCGRRIGDSALPSRGDGAMEAPPEAR